MEENSDVMIIEEIIHERSSSEIKSLPSIQDLSRVLECPVCLEIPFGPIVLCSSGHSICRICSSDKSHCPICMSSFTKMRSWGLESIISLLQFHCIYNAEGCNSSIPSGGMFKKHVECCAYRPIACNEQVGTPCSGFQVPFSKYVSHLSEYHHLCGTPSMDKLCLKQSLTPPMRCANREWAYSCFKFNDLIFLAKCQITQTAIYWWVCVLANPETASQYAANLTVISESPIKYLDKREKLDWRVPVVSIRNSGNVNVNSPEIAVHPLNKFFNMCKPEVVPCTTDKSSLRIKYGWELHVEIQKRNSEVAIKVEPTTLPNKNTAKKKVRRSKVEEIVIEL